MSRSIQLGELKGRVLRAADMQRQNTQGYAVADLADLINESAAALYDLIILAWEDYFVIPITLPMPPRSTPDVALPIDFYKLRSVTSGSADCPNVLTPIRELGRAVALVDPCVTGYQISGHNLTVLDDGSSQSFTLRYIPQATYLVADTDALDLGVIPGWEAYIVCDAAAALLAKADRNTAPLEARRDRIKSRIVEMAPDRDAGRPHQMQDAYGWSAMGDVL